MTIYKVFSRNGFPALLCILLVLALAVPAEAEEGFSLHTLAGASWQNWNSGLGNAPVKMKTESLLAMHLESRLAWRGRTLFSLAHGRTLNGSTTHDQTLVNVGQRESSVQETLGVLDFLAFIAGGERSRNGEMSFLHRLLGLKVSYTHNLYHGRTASADDFAYVDFSGWENATLFEKGAQLPFRTQFKDLRILTPVWYDPIYPGAVVRVGYFRSQWEKVASSSDVTLEGRPVVQDTRRDTSGLTLSYDNSLEWPGIGWGVSLDAGLLGSGLTTPKRFVNDESDKPIYSSFRAEIRWNVGGAGGGSGFATSLGAVFEWRSWQQNRKPIDRDMLTRIFGRVGFDLVV